MSATERLEALGYRQMKQRRSNNLMFINDSRGVRISFNRFNDTEFWVRFATWPAGSPASITTAEAIAAVYMLDELNRRDDA